ncbi:MAG: non-ribosomal peptide synthetase, partial [Candidatus Electrothrix sp. AR1]|nr:non-ribosomal peptide synthetase [Candidatus Electrothrix sp. AR1]
EEYKQVKEVCGPETRLINSYGITETTIDSTYFETVRMDCPGNSWVPIGRPFANTRMYILDTHQEPVPIGAVGELYSGGAGVARGYHNRPELTAERFLADHFVPESRMYRTGDLARYLPDSNIELLGRADDQVKIRGYRIELSEIENTLVKHPQVRLGVVIAREDSPGNKRLAAYVVAEGAQPAIKELREFLGSTLPDYMVPSAFVLLDAFPLTPNGKIDRRALPVPDSSSMVRETEFVAPRNTLEEQLAEIWSEVLGISPVGIRDNFIELGGHSLLAIRVIGLLYDRLQVELPITRLFQNPTIAKLAEAVRQQEGKGTRPPLQRVPRDRPLPLSYGQELMWVIDQFKPADQPMYNETLSIHLGGEVNIPALKASLKEFTRRHEIMRTKYQIIDEKPCQVILPPYDPPLLIINLQNLPETEREAEAVRIATEELCKPLDLALGNVLRVCLTQLSETDSRLYFSTHHIVSDAEADLIMVRELETLYQAFCQGKSSPLPELPIQFADFAVWQHQWLQGDFVADQLAYWKERLKDLSLLQLPTDYPRTAKTTFTGSFIRHPYSKDLFERLKLIGQQEGVTLFTILAAASKVLLYRYSGHEDIALATFNSQRDQPELEGLMGFFLNTFLLRSDLSGNPNFSELLQRVWNVCLEAYENQDVPFQHVIEALNPDRSVNLNPIVQAALTIDPLVATDDKLGWKAFTFEIDPQIAKFDLTFYIFQEVREKEETVFLLEYNTELFETSTIERMAEHFILLLEGIAAEPRRRISEFPLLTEKEQHRLLVKYDNRQVPYPLNKSIHQLFEEQTKKEPDAVAAIFADQKLT